MTKNVNQLAAGDIVLAIEDTVFTAPLTVEKVRTATLKGKTFPTFVMLNGGRFWPTGRTDKRTCTVA